MKTRKFENVQIGDIVTFEEKGLIYSARVCDVNENTFTLVTLRAWDNNGVTEFNQKFFNFYKTGTKSHSHYNYGNAIEITGKI